MHDPDPSFCPVVGVAELLSDGLRRIVAPNPSAMTFRGTNTYLLGHTDLAVIDPGPDSAPHMHAILAAVQPGQRITHILVTHAHLDHSPLARALSQVTKAPVLAFGDAQSGRSAVMQHLAQGGMLGGGEGIDTAFCPDHSLADGDVISGPDWQITALHTPGHMGNHLCFAWGDILFCGDLVMGWASSLVSPPDGDLTDFLASCRRMRARPWRIAHPGHGAPLFDPAARLNWLIAHRLQREAAILEALTQGPATAAALARAIYTQTPRALLPAAERNVLAHLVDLYGHSRVTAEGALHASAQFSRK